MCPQLLRRSSSRAGAATASTAVLLLFVTAACLAALVQGDAVVGKWNSIVTDAMVQKKIGGNMVRLKAWRCVWSRKASRALLD